VFVNEGLTLDFMDAPEPLPRHHYCFRVGSDDFDAILGRIKAAAIAFRSEVRGPIDAKINTRLGGKNVYWNDPDGHQWEILTVSYARPAH
jgi:catechol 2,3-dioxygenase-like lactoylglutathione lyase family enzyme